MDIETFGLDIGKHSFSFVGLDANKQTVIKRTCNRSQLFEWLQKQADAQQFLCVTMEACGGAHWLAGQIERMGHEARQLPAQYIKPYATARQKNDERDALAIAKAASDKSIKPVARQTGAQRAVLSLHKVRERLIGNRTALVNQMRAILWENGVTPRTGRKWFEGHIDQILQDCADALHPDLQCLLRAMSDELRDISHRIDAVTNEIEAVAKDTPDAQALLSIPGVGVMNATALVAHMGDATRFATGRHFSASLGLVPRQYSTGGKNKLLGITRHGNSYLRKLLVHGARSLLAYRSGASNSLVAKARKMIERGVPKPKVIVALANKLARIVWALLAKGGVYCSTTKTETNA